jgi:hypothetical protein
MRYRIAAGLSALLVVGGVLMATAQQAGASQEFSVVAHQTNFEFVPVGGPATTTLGPTTPPPTPGAEIIIRESLSQGTTVVGYDNVICTETFNNNALCDAVLVFDGKGDLHGTALIRDEFDPNSNGPAVFDATIDGGTFAYSHATGMLHLVVQPNGDTQDNIILN